MRVELPDRHTIEPPPRDCEGGCGKLIDPVWRTSPRTGRQHWVCGRNPCDHCRAVAEVTERQARKQHALDRAKLPPKLQGWGFARMELQPEDEHPGDFIRRLSASMRRQLGVLNVNAEPVSELRHWLDHRDSSVYLYGPAGTGKSTLAAAVVNHLATPVDQGWRERTEAELVEVFGDLVDNVPASRRRVRVLSESVDVLYIDEGELMARVRNAWSGDKDPLKRVSQVGLLVLDDLGTELLASSDRTRPKVVQAFERLVAYRYDHGLPMLITSNLPWTQIVDEHAYGRRVASRLSEMVGLDAWRIRGPDWRRPPQAEPGPAPTPQLDRKAAAAGDLVMF